ncbi:MAG TPA: aminopeptidase [Methanotrichaceae archaeon]|nr:aminopeptidase [Methanotrichaceae archaeon]
MNASTSNYASIVISSCLKVRPGEDVLIFTDSHKLQFAEDLARSTRDAGGAVSIVYIPDSIRPVEKITDLHAVSLAAADVVIYVLETETLGKESNEIDLSREVAFRHHLITLPLQHKGRVCMMPGFTEEMLGAVAIDYPQLDKRCRRLQEILADKTVRVTSELGTDVSFSLKGRKFVIDNGDLSRPGLHGNVPAGEIYTAPVEDAMDGRLVIDGSVGSLGMVERPFRIRLEGGVIKDLQPIGGKGRVFEKFAEICEFDAPATKTVGEFGIGLNPGAKIIGNMLIDEKVEGTVHFAFGDSYGLGRSSSEFHTDLLITNPSIFVEGECIMDKGKFVLDI